MRPSPRNLTSLVGAPWRGGAGTIEAVQAIAENISASFAETHAAARAEASPVAPSGAELPFLERVHALSKGLVLAGVDGEPIGDADLNVPLLLRAVADVLEHGLVDDAAARRLDPAARADGPSGWRVVRQAAPALHAGAAQAVASVCSVDLLATDAERLDGFLRLALNSGELGDALAAVLADAPTVERWYAQTAAVRNAEVASTLIDVLGALRSLTFRLAVPAAGGEPFAEPGGEPSARAADTPAAAEQLPSERAPAARAAPLDVAAAARAEGAALGGGAAAEGGGAAVRLGGAAAAEADGAEGAAEADAGALTAQHGAPLGRLAAERDGGDSPAPLLTAREGEHGQGARLGAGAAGADGADGERVGRLLDDTYFEPGSGAAAREAAARRAPFVLKVLLVGAEQLREPAASGGRAFTAYRLEVVSAGARPCRLLLRRFSAFVRLHKALVRLFPREQLGRRWDARLLAAKAPLGEGRLAAAVVERRLRLLREYLDALMAVPALPASEPMRAFFALGDEPPRDGGAALAAGGDGDGGDDGDDGGAAAAVARAQQLPVELGDGGGGRAPERLLGRRIKLLIDPPTAPARSLAAQLAAQRALCAGCGAALGGAAAAEALALPAEGGGGGGGGSSGGGSALFGSRAAGRAGGGASAASSALASLALRAKGSLALAGLSASGRVRLCHYTERAYCARCHSGGAAVIPARLLHGSDGRAHAVCDWAAQFLAIVHAQRLLCVSAINPALFRARPHLERLRRLRTEAHELALRVASLPDSRSTRAQLAAAMADAARAARWGPAAERAAEPAPMEELLLSPELFSMADLLAAAQPSAAEQLLPLVAAVQVLRAALARPPRGRAADAAGAGAAEGEDEELTGVDADALDSIDAQADAVLREAEGALRGVSLEFGDGSEASRGPAGGRQDDELTVTDEEVEAVLASALRGEL